MLDLADTLQISGAVGLMLGGLAALFRGRSSAAQVADDVAVGCAYGAFLGTVFGMSFWIFDSLSGGAR